MAAGAAKVGFDRCIIAAQKNVWAAALSTHSDRSAHVLADGLEEVRPPRTLKRGDVKIGLRLLTKWLVGSDASPSCARRPLVPIVFLGARLFPDTSLDCRRGVARGCSRPGLSALLGMGNSDRRRANCSSL